MARNWKLCLSDALTAINFIKEDTNKLSYNDFLQNRVLRQATERNVELIGEALNSVPTEIQINHPKIEWRNIIGMRNYLIHQYFSVVPDIVWEVATVHIFELETEIIKLINNSDI